MHLVQRNYSMAKSLYDRAIRASPHNAECISHYAILLWSTRDLANAERQFMSAMNVEASSTVHYLNYVNFKHSKACKAKAALQWPGSSFVLPSQAHMLPNSVTLHHDWRSSNPVALDPSTDGADSAAGLRTEDERPAKRRKGSKSPPSSRTVSPPPSPPAAAHDEPAKPVSECSAGSPLLPDEQDMTPWMSSIHRSGSCSGELGAAEICGDQSTDLEALFESLPMMIPC